MGKGYSYDCSNCDSEFAVGLGRGLFFPEDYAETLEKIRAGKAGEEWKRLLERTPDVAVDAELYFYTCDHCGSWANERSLSLYIPKDPEYTKNKERLPWSSVDDSSTPCVAAYQLQEEYTLLRAYVHVCPKCGKPLRQVTDEKELAARLAELPCPDCGEPTTGLPFLWD